MTKILLLLALILLPNLASAEETGELIAPKIINVSIIHPDYMEADQFGLLMKIPNAVSGCYHVSGLEYQTSFIEGNYMDIDVSGYRRTPMKTKDVAFDCAVGTQVITAMIPINAEDFRSRGIRQLRFKSGAIEDLYDVTVTSDSFTLTPTKATAFRPTNVNASGALVFNFAGQGIVALYVPMVNKGEDVAQAVQSLALKNGLMPASDPNMPNTAKVFYFIDNSGNILSQIGENGYFELGAVPAIRPYQGGNGKQSLPMPLKVFATKPGTTL